MPKLDKNLLIPYYRRQELKDLQATASLPEASRLGWAGGGTAIGAPLGALLGLAHAGPGSSAMRAGVGGVALGAAGSILGYLLARARNESRSEAKDTLGLPKRDLNKYLQNAAVGQYLSDTYGLQRAGRPITNVRTTVIR